MLKFLVKSTVKLVGKEEYMEKVLDYDFVFYKYDIKEIGLLTAVYKLFKVWRSV